MQKVKNLQNKIGIKNGHFIFAISLTREYHMAFIIINTFQNGEYYLTFVDDHGSKILKKKVQNELIIVKGKKSEDFIEKILMEWVLGPGKKYAQTIFENKENRVEKLTSEVYLLSKP